MKQLYDTRKTGRVKIHRIRATFALGKTNWLIRLTAGDKPRFGEDERRAIRVPIDQARRIIDAVKQAGGKAELA